MQPVLAVDLESRRRPHVRRVRDVVRLALLCAGPLLLSACAILRGGADVWPQSLPPKAHFVRIWQADEALKAAQPLDDYLYWVKSFYAGTPLYPRGWNDLVADQLAVAGEGPAARRRQRQLDVLGRDIAAEWAKANSVRRVDNRHLAVWGAAAGRAIDENNVDATLRRIAEDLGALMSGTLPADAIRAERYHEQDPDDWFAF